MTSKAVVFIITFIFVAAAAASPPPLQDEIISELISQEILFRSKFEQILHKLCSILLEIIVKKLNELEKNEQEAQKKKNMYYGWRG